MTPTEEAIYYLTTCCHGIGAFHGTTDVHEFLKKVSKNIIDAKESVVFPNRYREHVAYAIDMVASNEFTSPPASIAAVYLNTRFEYYFRILSRKLCPDGTWISERVYDEVRIKLARLKLRKGGVSRVSHAYKIMKINDSLSISKCCIDIDAALYSRPNMALGETIEDIGDRIELLRNRTAHGYWGDISAEAIFYGLLTAIIFYNQN